MTEANEMVRRVTDALRAGGSYEDMARAAIEALREPTQTMEYVGGTKLEDMMFGGDPEGTGTIFKDMGIVYRDMIDASLKD